MKRSTEDGLVQSLALLPVAQTMTRCLGCNAPRPSDTLLCKKCGYHHGLRQRFEVAKQQKVNWFRIFLAVVFIQAVVAALAMWSLATVGKAFFFAGAMFFIALILAIGKQVGSKIDVDTFLLFIRRSRGWRPLWSTGTQKVLDMRATNTTDEDLRSLKPDWGVQVLDLENTLVTDAGVELLASLNSLKFLVLRGTHISRNGFEELEQRLPKTRIWR